MVLLENRSTLKANQVRKHTISTHDPTKHYIFKVKTGDKTYFIISAYDATKNDFLTSSTTCCERVRCLLLEFQKIKTDFEKNYIGKMILEEDKKLILTGTLGGGKVNVRQYLLRTKSSSSSLSL